MIQLRKIFCVIDPTTNTQRALTRAAYIASGTGAAVHAYLCIYSHSDQPSEDREDMRAAELAKHDAWLERIVETVRARGVEVSVEIDWQDDWRAALGPAAARAGADLIVKSSFRRSAPQRRLLKTADWTLMRSAPCPVLLVKSDLPLSQGSVLAAVHLGAEDPEHQALNDAVIAYANSVASAAGVDLHAVNAYAGSDHFVHPPDLARRVGIPRTHAHVGDAEPEELIAQVAREIGAQLVVVGSVARRGIRGAVVGNTAERILDHVDADVVAVFSRHEVGQAQASG